MQAERQADGQMERQTGRQTDGQTDRQTKLVVTFCNFENEPKNVSFII